MASEMRRFSGTQRRMSGMRVDPRIGAHMQALHAADWVMASEPSVVVVDFQGIRGRGVNNYPFVVLRAVLRGSAWADSPSWRASIGAPKEFSSGSWRQDGRPGGPAQPPFASL